MPTTTNVLMLGNGEYTTGFTGEGASGSDKSTGVVALTTLDLKRRGKVGRVGMCGTNGKKMPAIRRHMQEVIGPDVYAGIDPAVIETWPEDGVVNREAYKVAVASFSPGDVAIIFTPDDTHMTIARCCLEQGMHVMITKPPVKTLEDHLELIRLTTEKDRLCAIEVHKRFDPIYVDARDRIAELGPFSYFTAYMSQPKYQLDTFKAWAGKSSDISYYLNSHHVDFHEWALGGSARPERVTALASTGVADERLGGGVETEDTITLAVQWRNRNGESFAGGTLGHATYTSSWIAPKADVHSQQRWFYMGQKGEVTVDQAHRGYTVAQDDAPFGSANPLFWKPAADAVTKEFKGQRCYGYISFESFVDAAADCNAGARSPRDFDGALATITTTAGATAVLEAGRRSLDRGGLPVDLVYPDDASHVPGGLRDADS